MSVTVGAHTPRQPEILGQGKANVTIGKYCSFAEGVCICLGGAHNPNRISTYAFAEFQHPDLETSNADVTIGNDVWIGANALILHGVHVGDGAVIGAGSVVVSNVEPYSVMVGNPARLIRKRFTDAEIQTLLALKWWDWPDEKVQRNLSLLIDSNIEKLKALVTA